MEKVLFKEEQRFTQWWLWLIMAITLLSVLIPFAYGMHSQEVLDKPFGENPMSTGGLVVTGIMELRVEENMDNLIRFPEVQDYSFILKMVKGF